MPGSPDANGTAPRGVRIQHLTALGDFHLTGLGELPRDPARLVHQLTPVPAADRSSRVRRAGAAVRAPQFGQRKHRGFQPLPGRSVGQGYLSVMPARAPGGNGSA